MTSRIGRDDSNTAPAARATVLYDGECDFCVALARRFAPSAQRAGFQLQTLPTASHLASFRAGAGETTGEGFDSMMVIPAGGATLRYGEAVAFLARHVWWGFPLRMLAALPGGMFLIDAGYRWVARNRGCLNGAVWLVITRLGATPMQLGEPIVLLTAVHFHFSGFALAFIAGATGGSLPTQGVARNVFQFITVGILAGTFLIAIGFLASPGWKVAAIALFYSNLPALAGYLILGRSRVKSRLPRALLAVSSGSLAIGMTLALIYAAGEYSGDLLIDIPGMALWHGPINAIGFTLCALLGWVSAQSEARPIAR